MIINPYTFVTGSGSGDPYWSSVKSLAHFDVDFSDSAGAVWTPGTGIIDTSDSKFGTGCLKSSGGAPAIHMSSTIPKPSSSDDFTFEMFYKPVTLGRFFNTYPISGTTENNMIFDSATSKLTLYTIGINPLTSSPTAMATGNWYHVAWSRNGGVSRFYVAGILQGSYADAYVYSLSTIYLLTNNYANAAIAGKMNEFRYTLGVGRYPTSFAPPTAPFLNH